MINGWFFFSSHLFMKKMECENRRIATETWETLHTEHKIYTSPRFVKITNWTERNASRD